MSVVHRLNIVPAVQWHEGMLLSPHHFQQQEIRNEQKLSHHTRLLPYPHYGIHTLEIDLIVLPNGTVKVLSLEAVMPDSLIVSYKDSPELPPLELKLEKKDQETTVYLCLSRADFLENDLSGSCPRYQSTSTQVVDLNTGENPIDIPVIVPRLFLKGSDLDPWAIGFPILKLKFQDGFFEKMPFTYSCFFLTQDLDLWKECAALARKIREKATYYMERYQAACGTSIFLETGMILRSLLCALIQYETAVHGPSTHPCVIYQILCQTLAHLSALNPRHMPPIFSGYLHHDIDRCFGDLFALAYQYLDALDYAYTVTRFQKKDRLFSMMLPKNPGSHFYIGVKGAHHSTYNEIEKWVHDAIICSDFAIETIRSQRIIGADRILLKDEDIKGLLPSRDILIFQVKIDPLFVKEQHYLHIFNPSDQEKNRPLEIFHYIPHLSKNL
jgi:type VI secretion system protein ImpJ